MIDIIRTNKAEKMNMEKDLIIEKQKNKIISLQKEIINLNNKINELKGIITWKSNIESKFENANNYITLLKSQIEDISKKNEEREKELKQQINIIISEKEKEKIKSKKDQIICEQKMSVVKSIEKENDIYKNEISELKEKQKKLETSTKEKIERITFDHYLKYKNLKSQMMNNLNLTKENISKLKLEYMNINGRITILQNYQLINELEHLSRQNNDLVNENSDLKNQIFKLKKELDIHEKVEIKLASKIKNIKNSQPNMKNRTQSIKGKSINEYNNKSSSSLYTPRMSERDKNNLDPKNNSISHQILKTIKKMMMENGSDKLHDIEYSRNNRNRIDRRKKKSNSCNYINNLESNFNDNQKNNFQENFFQNFFEPSTGTRKKTSKGKTYNFFNKYMKNKKEENEKLKNIIENLNHKIYTYEGQYKGLFYFLEECLEKFFKDVEKKIREKEDDRNIYIDIQKIKKFDFSIFNDIEKYNLLILVMNYLLPLVTNNFKSNCNIKKDLFCTNLNLINRNYNQNDIYLKDKLLRKAFLDKNFKLKSDLFIENNDNFSNSIPILRKNKSIYFHGDNTILDNIIYNN